MDTEGDTIAKRKNYPYDTELYTHTHKLCLFDISNGLSLDYFITNWFVFGQYI